MYKSLIRPILFKFDPEEVHHFTFSMLKNFGFLTKLFLPKPIVDKRLEREVFGLKFKNPVGLAAGFDKNAVLFNELGDLGFGFVEIGTVTPKAQAGNPKKRLFRLIEDGGIINRMGFNNDGLETAIEKLKSNKGKIIIGGNIGKNTNTTPENYTQDYLDCFEGLHPYVDYFVLNVSCPNVGSHAKLEDVEYLRELITAVKGINQTKVNPKPILLKIAPDLNDQQLDEIIELIAETKIDGIVVSNTSVNREGLKTSPEVLAAIGNGGLSGKPIRERSTKMIKYLSDKSNRAFPIIGVGGIHSAKDAIEKLDAGATLVQLYTGFIYEGPQLINDINQELLTRASRISR
ncbi:quinone-dependent dihydroorotate dehydrogenase [Chryseobacterium sp. Ch-15]|uniref:Dihydroorotate dehydrogenase (quinone) n=1 Tax=Chryseobacterium muglaense TaxID=2893752 RepID=A0A9Q3UTT4_9FLAO|nr:quinone-dependent dihydroorotate dehydrogenase [Chryseobacterium muglaense]MBD3905524.1 quinone-dependent dihydroorotate dehydrogenase [Chryseobacterium muglaense]MCC9034999.1 quinone-dependent dihydroorotate dehydrogenase [Chryseobacterium muglaense]MCM2555572.1 quinone-dependent dihydroorotate dehydrogenase [Chryseobacterium muglaense]